jgi:hypothetical protein
MEISESLAVTKPNNKRVAPLTVLLGVVFVVFCGILVFVYVATKRANPVMLDQQGKPLGQSSESAKPSTPQNGAH